MPGVGVLYEPHAEVRYTNGLDFRNVHRANSLGFLDREPPDPTRATASRPTPRARPRAATSP